MNILSHRGLTKVVFLDSLSVDIFSGLELSSALFLIDEALVPLFCDIFSLNFFVNCHSISIPASEDSKSLTFLCQLLNQIYTDGLIPSHIITFGGGTIQDVSGFLAALIRRGIKWTYLPTTLLAMADSSIGSKVSINVGSKKNQIGLFFPPSSILIYPPLLDSLPEREYVSGCGDILHYALQSSFIDPIFKSHLPMVFAGSTHEAIKDLVRATLEVKRPFVEKDEFDLGLRKSLNLGHTFAHAIESASLFCIPHGIAVIIGCALAFHFSSRKNLVQTYFLVDHFRLMNQLLLRAYSYFGQHTIDQGIFRSSLACDKKNSRLGHVLLILPSGLDQSSYVMIKEDYPLKEISTFISEFLSDSSFCRNLLTFPHFS